MRRRGITRRAIVAVIVAATPTARRLSNAYEGGARAAPGRTTLQVNGSTSPAAVIAGDGIWVAVRGVPASTGVTVALEDGSGARYNSVSTGNPAPTNIDYVMYLTQLNPIFASSEPLKTPGTYYVRLNFNGDPTVQAQVGFTVNAYVVPPFPPINAASNPNGMLFGIMRVSAVGSGSTLAGGNGTGQAATCLAVKGTIGVTTAWQGPAGNPSPPRHTTMQYYLVGGDGTYHPLGPPVYSDTNPTVSSFDTTTLPDGSYIIWAKIIDMNDVSHSDLGGWWNATLIGIMPQPIVIYNGSTPMDPAGTYTLPVSYYGNNFRATSTTPDFLRYQGLPAAARDYPYPSAGSSPPNVLPVWNPSSPYHSDPASARKPAKGFWFETVNGLRTQEYKTAVEWRSTNAGGIFAQPLVGKTVAGNSIEASYPTVARGSYQDGGRNSSPSTGFAVAVATPTRGRGRLIIGRYSMRVGVLR